MPNVSIIVPCYNEQQTIGLLLSAIYSQTYPRQLMEIIIADGLSEDGTRHAVAEFEQSHPDLMLRVVDNVSRSIPAGLNTALRAAVGDIIIRLDAHSSPFPEYVTECVTALEAGKGENVGGVWEIRSQDDGWQAKSIAVAAAHPLGVGDALYRHTTQAAYVDTVPFGAFYRSLIDRVGEFDETLLANEDYEFNARIRQANGKVWLNPAIRSIYYARPTLIALWKQYWRYGYWKYRMLRRYPGTLRWRQAFPPVFVLGLIVGLILSPLMLWARLLYLFVVGFYAFILSITGVQAALHRKYFFFVFGLPLAMATMHIAWGSGFLWSLFSSNGAVNHG